LRQSSSDVKAAAKHVFKRKSSLTVFVNSVLPLVLGWSSALQREGNGRALPETEPREDFAPRPLFQQSTKPLQRSFQAKLSQY
jgi:hypothetical protein